MSDVSKRINQIPVRVDPITGTEIFLEPIDSVHLLMYGGRGRGRPIRWPFDKLEVGHSFYVMAKKDFANIRNSCVYWNRKFLAEGRQFVVRRCSVGLKVIRLC